MDIIQNLVGLWIYSDPNAPLERENEDGTRTPVLAWKYGYRVLVHPDRRELFDKACMLLAYRRNPPRFDDDKPSPAVERRRHMEITAQGVLDTMSLFKSRKPDTLEEVLAIVAELARKET